MGKAGKAIKVTGKALRFAFNPVGETTRKVKGKVDEGRRRAFFQTLKLRASEYEIKDEQFEQVKKILDSIDEIETKKKELETAIEKLKDEKKKKKLVEEKDALSAKSIELENQLKENPSYKQYIDILVHREKYVKYYLSRQTAAKFKKGRLSNFLKYRLNLFNIFSYAIAIDFAFTAFPLFLSFQFLTFFSIIFNWHSWVNWRASLGRLKLLFSDVELHAASITRFIGAEIEAPIRMPINPVNKDVDFKRCIEQGYHNKTCEYMYWDLGTFEGEKWNSHVRADIDKVENFQRQLESDGILEDDLMREITTRIFDIQQLGLTPTKEEKRRGMGNVFETKTNIIIYYLTFGVKYFIVSYLVLKSKIKSYKGKFSTFLYERNNDLGKWRVIFRLMLFGGTPGKVGKVKRITKIEYGFLGLFKIFDNIALSLYKNNLVDMKKVREDIKNLAETIAGMITPEMQRNWSKIEDMIKVEGDAYAEITQWFVYIKDKKKEELLERIKTLPDDTFNEIAGRLGVKKLDKYAKNKEAYAGEIVKKLLKLNDEVIRKNMQFWHHFKAQAAYFETLRQMLFLFLKQDKLDKMDDYQVLEWIYFIVSRPLLTKMPEGFKMPKMV